MFRMKTNEQYSLVVELYNRDYTTWERQQTYVNGTGMWVESNNTSKYQYHYGSSNTLYYTKTLIRFKKTCSLPPVFVYFTINFDDKGGDLNSYPKEFKNQIYLVAYGVEGLTDHVDSEVYDAHEAFEIDKTKMKMLVPLDMNNKKIMNTNFDLKFRDLFKIIKCYVPPPSETNYGILKRKSDNQNVAFSNPVVIHAIIVKKIITNVKEYLEIVTRSIGAHVRLSLFNHPHTRLEIFETGIRVFRFYGTGDKTIRCRYYSNRYVICPSNKMKKDIFEFNHIDNLLSEDEIKTIKEFYEYYHKKFWCFKKTYKHFKILDESINISGILLMIIGTISGGLTMNPIILGVINGFGILLTNVGKMKGYKKKIEMTNIAFTTYEKVLVELRSALRGDKFDKDLFIDKMKVIDEMIIDQTPLADKFTKKYDKKYK